MSAGALFTRPVSLPPLVGIEQTGYAVSQLALARGSKLDGPTLTAYMDALADLAPTMVERACFDLARVTRREYETAVPSAPAIRERCEQIARADEDAARAARMLPEPQREDDEPRFFCADCRDESSGWQVVRCGGSGPHRDRILPPHEAALPFQFCGRSQAHAAHAFTVRCACWQRNPVVARRHAAQQRRKAS